MMLHILFIISIFYGNSKILSAEKAETLPPNQSSDLYELENWFHKNSRPKSKSPSSRSSSAARPTDQSPQFWTPSSSPVPAVLIQTVPTSNLTAVNTRPNIPQSKSNNSLSDWDLGEEETKKWQDIAHEFDTFKNRNGTTTYQLKKKKTPKQTSKFETFAEHLRSAATEATMVVALLPDIFEAWRNNSN